RPEIGLHQLTDLGTVRRVALFLERFQRPQQGLIQGLDPVLINGLNQAFLGAKMIVDRRYVYLSFSRDFTQEGFVSLLSEQPQRGFKNSLARIGGTRTVHGHSPLQTLV